VVSTSQKGDLVGFSFGQYNIASLFLSMVCLVWLFRIFYGDIFLFSSLLGDTFLLKCIAASLLSACLDAVLNSGHS